MKGLIRVCSQWSELKPQALKTWTPAWGEMQNLNLLNPRQSSDQALAFQEKVITSSLELQGLFTRSSRKAQQQFWQNYFKML